MDLKTASSGRSEQFAAILYSEPAALGLVCVHLILIGGFLQLTSGILSFRRNDHLIGTTLAVFATLWIYQGFANIVMKNSSSDVTKTALPVLIAYGTIALSLFLCSLFVNFIIPPILVAMTLTLIFESVGLFYDWGKKTAVAFELIIVLTAIYAVIVIATKGISQRYILPGFGNAPIDPLLIKRNVKGSNKKEKRKNTKYAEPMGMGYMGSTIPATVVCFLGLGYFQDMRVPIIGIGCGSFLQLLASYYSFLRGDVFNSVQFMVHFIFWTSKSYFFYILSIDSNQMTSTVNYYGSWGVVLALVFITVCSSTQPIVVFMYNCLLTSTSVLSVDHIPQSIQYYTFGISAILLWIFTVYISTAFLLNSCAEKPVLFVGSELVSEERLFFCCKKKTERNEEENDTSEVEDDEKRVQIINTLFFLCNMVAAIALSPLEIANQKASFSFLLSAGVVGNAINARYSYASASLSHAFVCLTGSVIWSAWSIHIFHATGIDGDSAVAIISIGLCALSLVVTFSMPRTWTVLVSFLMVHSVSIITKVYNAEAKYYPLVSSVLVGLVGLYGFILYLGKGISNKRVFPEGEPLLKMRKPKMSKLPCPTFRSRIASDMFKAAEVLKSGEVICVPTDTVYALAGSCTQPESISKIYHIKGRPPEKPICLCISNLEQLKAANPPFSPLLWRFMDRCYPGGITCVVKKGDWLQNLGVGKAAEYVGTEESVAIRVPDSSVLSYLVSLTGPLSITSANPSGEPDSTHHSTVIDTLGEKLAGVVCDDESNETVASTVVNCMKIDEGVISYFRVGCVPLEIVDKLFADVKKEIQE
ncbi:uncharacterized protein LOC133189688 [Saccostrea echinata]|uniref:uncharacterized protein LOC133189688 n=1 Tax=Saccostrea echinata TaxID=191078 RepID=UPI002A83712B|nr:uncharacterized protein LOC133189688 [Saccostrea echinata]